MKIIICGSMSAHQKMSEVQKYLTALGHAVKMPNLDFIDQQIDNEGNSIENAQIKIENNFIKIWFESIRESDAVLAINEDKKGIKGYIGPNTFLEIGFGYALGKKVYILNNYSKELPYQDEINAMQPIILNGNLNGIK